MRSLMRLPMNIVTIFEWSKLILMLVIQCKWWNTSFIVIFLPSELPLLDDKKKKKWWKFWSKNGWWCFPWFGVYRREQCGCAVTCCHFVLVHVGFLWCGSYSFYFVHSFSTFIIYGVGDSSVHFIDSFVTDFFIISKNLYIFLFCFIIISPAYYVAVSFQMSKLQNVVLKS